MEQTASGALITSIIAVVLGGLGLIGGVVGYVQGSAALRRATLTRQRATAAEEAAHQAQAKAEQAARAVAESAERLEALQPGLLGSAGIAPAAIGSRRATARSDGGPQARTNGAAPTNVAPAFGSSVPQSFATGPTPVAESMPTEAVEPAPAQEPEPAPEPSRDPEHASEPEPEPEPKPEPDSDPDSEPQVESEPQPEPEPERQSPTLPASPPESSGSPEPAPEAPSRSSVFVVQSASVVQQRTDADAAPEEPKGADAPAPEQPAEPSDEPDPQPEQQEAPEPETPSRGSTGQVFAGGQAAAQMDWAEALRTGAIPLPSVSRGTYAAPGKAKPRTPSGPARFEIRHVGRQRFEASNVGGAVADDAVVEGTGEDRHLVSPLETRPKSVEPGAALAFSVLRVEGRSVSVRIAWRSGEQPAEVELPVE